MRYFRIFFLIAILLLSSCSFTNPCANPQSTSCTRVLFIGNSYIFVNDLPKTFAELAESSGHHVVVGSSAQGGWRLSMHAQSEDTLNLLDSGNWNYVVLQEQSQIPSVQLFRAQNFYPAARTLIKRVRDEGATPLFFLTWAHRNGWPENGMLGYQSMQSQINNGYYAISLELNVPVVPVGTAWGSILRQYPDINLWQEDGSHPTMEGTYLAACVFYAAIFQESPVNNTYWADLPEDTAVKLQTVAAEVVLNIRPQLMK